MYKIIKITSITLLALATLSSLIYIAYRTSKPTIEIRTVTTTKDISSIQYQAKVDTLKAEVVALLRACESSGFKETDGLIIFDSNKVASVGTLQFQKKTVIYYYKTLYGKDISGKEALLIALDDTLSGQLATDIMFTTKNKAGKDWYNCTVRHNLDAKIDIINKL